MQIYNFFPIRQQRYAGCGLNSIGGTASFCDSAPGFIFSIGVSTYELTYSLSIIPLASYHLQVVASYGAEVADSVVAAVDISQGLVKRNIKHGQLIVVAEESFKESLVGKIELREVVVRAVNEQKVGAILH